MQYVTLGLKLNVYSDMKLQLSDIQTGENLKGASNLVNVQRKCYNMYYVLTRNRI